MSKPYSKSSSTFHAEREKKEPKAKKAIAKKSKKLIDAEKIYNKERKAYLQAYPYCETNCGMGASQIHHRKGRIGSLLTNINYFMAVCAECHKWIEEHPLEAKEKGYSLNRL